MKIVRYRAEAIAEPIRIFALVVLILVASGCSDKPQETLEHTPIVVQLRWIHQAQFAGFYAAEQNGFYAQEGLDVSFLEGGPQVDLHAPVLDGTAQFGVASAETLVVAQASGEPLRAIATVYRRSPLVFASLADSGIERPQDFVGRTIDVSAPAEVVFKAMMARVGIAPDQYTTVRLGRDNVQSVLTGDVDVVTVYVNNMVSQIRASGEEVNVIYPDNYGVHFYADTLFATDDFIEQNPDTVLRFLRATLRGWTYVIENPQSIAELILPYNPDADPAHEVDFLTSSIPLINTGEDYIGWMKPERWAAMANTLLEQGVISAPIDATQVYTLQFLQEIYGAENDQ